MDHTVVGWRAWYYGGRVYDSVRHRWEDLPANGIVAVLAYERVRPHRRLVTGKSLYWMDADGPHGWGYDQTDPSWVTCDPPVHFDGRRVKGGAWVTDQEFASICAEAMAAEAAPDERLREGPCPRLGT